MQNLLSRRSGPALVIAALAAIVIGCGGGGGGGGSNGNTNATDGSTNASAGTLTNGTSAGTDGGAGSLPQDSVFYVQADGLTFDVRYTKADMTGQGTYAADVANDNSPMVANPNVEGEFVFAAIPAGGTTYGIYRNTTNSTVGATVVVTPRYSSVSSLQISRDGSRIVYIATVGDVNTAPFRLIQTLSAANSTPNDIDEADYASLSSAGDRVVYSKFPSAADNDTELYIRTLTPVAATSVRLTNNALYDVEPQFSKDGTLVVFSQQVPSTNRYRLAWVNLATAAVTTLDPVPSVEQQSSPSLNGAGNRVSFIVRSNGPASESGLYVADFPSGGNPTQVVSSADLRIGTYWSTPLGRSNGADALRLSIPRKR